MKNIIKRNKLGNCHTPLKEIADNKHAHTHTQAYASRRIHTDVYLITDRNTK